MSIKNQTVLIQRGTVFVLSFYVVLSADTADDVCNDEVDDDAADDDF